MSELPVKKDKFGALNKSAAKFQSTKKIRVIELPKKTNWKKLIKAVVKLIEPELKKLPKYYFIVPISLVALEFYGIFHFTRFIISLFTK